MRSFTVIGTLILLILSTACTGVGNDITSPYGTDLLNTGKGQDNHLDECRANMRTIASQCIIFFAGNNRYPSTMEEIDMAGVVCPSCNLTYQLVGTKTEFYVGCPIPLEITHGFIDNGTVSWIDSFTTECRETMRAIASACATYYAINSTYPADMEELGEPYNEMTCPECGQPYNLKGDTEHFALDCPLTPVISHGSIVDGIVSWTGEPGNGQDACRANMRTIASQCVIFFAGNDRYPESLEEIGMGDIVCGDCGLPYEFTGEEISYHLECPLPYDPNHGNIDDGVASW